MQFKPVDRLPCVEWAPWWDTTIARWHSEGLPRNLTDGTEIARYFDLDVIEQVWVRSSRSTFPWPKHGQAAVPDMDAYQRIKPHLFPDPKQAFDHDAVQKMAQRQASGELVVWLTFNGYFWFPRQMMGIENHLYAFYEQPDTLLAMNEDLAAYHRQTLDAFCSICVPDFMTFAEDMSYNNGPMVSKELFDTFMAPYYRMMVPRLKEHGVIPIVDSDGDIGQMIPWFLDVGVDGFLPLERQAGCDIARYRTLYPKTRYIGAFDKMVMSQGEDAMRAEFERLLPVMQQGGFVPGCDHQTPPEVSLDNYRTYVRLLKNIVVGVREEPANPR